MSKMLNVLRFSKYLPTLVTIVLAVVALVESIKNGESGEDKKKTALESLGSMWNKLCKDQKWDLKFEKVEPILSDMIDVAVAIYNATKMFKASAEIEVETAQV